MPHKYRFRLVPIESAQLDYKPLGLLNAQEARYHRCRPILVLERAFCAFKGENFEV